MSRPCQLLALTSLSCLYLLLLVLMLTSQALSFRLLLLSTVTEKRTSPGGSCGVELHLVLRLRGRRVRCRLVWKVRIL